MEQSFTDETKVSPEGQEFQDSCAPRQPSLRYPLFVG